MSDDSGWKNYNKRREEYKKNVRKIRRDSAINLFFIYGLILTGIAIVILELFK